MRAMDSRTITRLVALGDSTVEGLEDPGPDGGYVGWADRFAHRLAAAHPGLAYANLAVRGQTSADVRRTQLDAALALEPDLAILVAGVNDLLRPRFEADRMREDLLAMFAALRGHGAEVLTFTMPDMARVAPLAFAVRPRIERLNDVLRETGAAYGVRVVDLAVLPFASHPALWHDDRLHANSEGHRRISAALAEAMGLETEDWRSEPDRPVAVGLARTALHEAGWLATHVVPWLWGRLRGRPPEGGGVPKRPDLLPVV